MIKLRPGESTPDSVRSPDTTAGGGPVTYELLTAQVLERIDRIIAAQMRQAGVREQEREDIRSEILVKVMSRLNEFADDPTTSAIASFNDYVAVVAFNTFSDFVRRTHPLRTRLKARIRYLLSRDRRFAIWDTASGWACGLSGWEDRKVGTVSGDAFDSSRLPHDNLAAALLKLFSVADQPLLLDQVVTVVAGLQGIPVHERSHGLRDLPAPARTIVDDLEASQYIQQLWNEIRALPLRQRVALLLQARDSRGESVTRLLPITQVASFNDIAEALGMNSDTLAALWDRLPLDDLTIAARLGIQRQQVINLRRAARDRLSRRMRGDDR